MDIKDLLSLAKDNQSYTQKKFERDKLQKGNQKGRNDVSSAAVQVFLAKKQKEQQRQKDMEDAARRKRIQDRLQASQGKSLGNTSKPAKVDKTGKATSESINPKLEELRRQNLRHIKKPSTQEKQRISKDDQSALPTSKVRDLKKPTGRKISSKVDFKQLMEVAKCQAGKTPEAPAKKDFKQHRRKKGSSETKFEWSGSSSVLESKKGDAASKKAEKEYQSKVERTKEINSKIDDTRKRKTVKKAATTVNFKDLLKVAQQQANKPVAQVQRKEATAALQSPNGEKKVMKKRPGAERKGRCLDINSISSTKSATSNLMPQSNPGPSRSGGCKLVTRTVDNKRSYEAPQQRFSSEYRQQKRSVLGSNGRHGPSAGNRNKFQSIDDELERERRELEKRRNMLKRKMQGHMPQEDDVSDFSEYSEDDYDDEMADFIDDGGEEADYSKHIRSIFGYDRRQFHDDDDDLAGMESNFRQIAAEEARSAKIAKLEDEIEKRREEMELQRSRKRR